jgi:hypothetical protein
MTSVRGRPVSSIGRALGDYEIFSTFIRTVLLLWYVQKFQFLAKVETTSTGELLDSLLRNDAMAELCSGKFNVAYCRDPE